MLAHRGCGRSFELGFTGRSKSPLSVTDDCVFIKGTKRMRRHAGTRDLKREIIRKCCSGARSQNRTLLPYRFQPVHLNSALARLGTLPRWVVCRAAEYGLTMGRNLKFPDRASRRRPNDGVPRQVPLER